MLRAWIGIVVGVVAWSAVGLGSLDAGEPYVRRSWWLLGSDCCCETPFDTCCDDYCRRPPPRIPCRVDRCGCDDYCRKPQPCTTRPQLTCVDDYDCKPLPRMCPPRSPRGVCVPYCVRVSDSEPKSSGVVRVR